MRHWITKTGSIIVITAFVLGLFPSYVIPTKAGWPQDNNRLPSRELNNQSFDFDIIYINNITIGLPVGSGIGFINSSFGLVINTGSDPIAKEDLDHDHAFATASSPVEGVDLTILFNNENNFTPILPHQAWGSIDEHNLFLTDLLNTNETLKNMTPYQTFAFGIDRDTDFTGIAHFNVTIQIKDKVSKFGVDIKFINGQDWTYEFHSGQRAQSHIKTVSAPVISGPHQAKVILPISFNFSADPERLHLFIDWGDGTLSDWSHLRMPPFNASHTWNTSGSYTIHAKVKDAAGIESNWSDPYTITIQEPKKSLIIGKIANMTSDGTLITVGAASLWIIKREPLQFLHLTNGESIQFMEDYKGIMTSQFIGGFFKIIP